MGAATSMIFVMTNTRNKTRLQQQRKYACQDKAFVVTNMCLSGQRFCHKHTFVATKDVFCRDKRVCRDKSKLVMTKPLLQQAYFYHNRTRLMSRQNCCRDKNDTYGSSHQYLTAYRSRQYLTAYQPTTQSHQKERQTNTCTHTITL